MTLDELITALQRESADIREHYLNAPMDRFAIVAMEGKIAIQWVSSARFVPGNFDADLGRGTGSSFIKVIEISDAMDKSPV